MTVYFTVHIRQNISICLQFIAFNLLSPFYYWAHPERFLVFIYYFLVIVSFIAFLISCIHMLRFLFASFVLKGTIIIYIENSYLIINPTLNLTLAYVLCSYFFFADALNIFLLYSGYPGHYSRGLYVLFNCDVQFDMDV